LRRLLQDLLSLNTLRLLLTMLLLNMLNLGPFLPLPPPPPLLLETSQLFVELMQVHVRAHGQHVGHGPIHHRTISMLNSSVADSSYSSSAVLFCGLCGGPDSNRLFCSGLEGRPGDTVFQWCDEWRAG
jgi:hypothetical protein